MDDDRAMMVLLTKLYRLAYESIDSDKAHDLENKYNDIIKDYKNELSLNLDHKIPKSPQELVQVLQDVIISFNKITEKISADKAKIKLIKYCESYNIDAAILLLLKFKLNNNNNESITEICNYIHDYSTVLDRGWWGTMTTNYSKSAIHFLMESINKNKNKCDMKTLLLFEIFLREQTSTKLILTTKGWETYSKPLLDIALEQNNMDILRLLFKYGCDIDGNVECKYNQYSKHDTTKEIYKSIHTAIKHNNYELIELMIKAGSNINEYKTYYSEGQDYGDSDEQSEEITALYQICGRTISWRWRKHNVDDDNKMLKVVLNAYKEKSNDIPNVNLLSVYMIAESEYDLGLSKVNKNNKCWDIFIPRIKLYTYSACIHAAVEKCDIEMIKILLIYGADLSIYKIKTSKHYNSNNIKTHKEILKMQKEEKKKQINIPNNYEYIKDVFDILNESKCEDKKIKNSIYKILKNGSRYFPELIDLYPNNMALSIKNIFEILQIKNSIHFPDEIINIVINYFYDILQKTENNQQIIELTTKKAER